jgi:IS5 family transposase
MGKLLNLPILIPPKPTKDDSDYYNKNLKELDVVLRSLPNLEQLLTQVLKDVYPKTGGGRDGMPAIQIIKCGLLRKIKQIEYREMEEACKDSVSVMRFLELGYGEYFSKTKLNNVIRRVKASTWELINQSMIEFAVKKDIEPGDSVKIDCFGVKTDIHYPTDSSLMYDLIKVVCRATSRIKDILGDQLDYKIVDRTRTAKSMLFQINNLKQAKRKRKCILKLIRTTDQLLSGTEGLILYLTSKVFDFKTVLEGTHYNSLLSKLKEDYKLGLKVHDQAYRRNLKDEKLKAEDKIVSMYESHTDIIVKGKRDILFGHKLCAATSSIGLIIKMNVLTGNPNDSTLFKDQLTGSVEIFKTTKIKTCVADGCFASTANFNYAIKQGVENLSFIKNKEFDYGKCKDDKRFKKKLRNLRAGIEADLSNLIRGYGMKRILEKGRDCFDASCQLSCLAYNSILIVRAIIKKKEQEALKILQKAA